MYEKGYDAFVNINFCLNFCLIIYRLLIPQNVNYTEMRQINARKNA